ncbi:MAG: GspH/FimT family pseudopilin [Coxiellaceae bacterium]|nr:MAG: GspH/FimT family pseudopilin [Coxiellaceae bacterium]
MIELLVTLTITIILLSMGVYALHSIGINNRSDVAVNQLVAAIQFARTSAIQQATTVTFCGSSNGHDCDGNWQAGQLIKTPQQILRVYPAVAAGDHLFWSGNFSQNAVIEFVSTGFTNGQQGSFYYCAQQQQYAKRIVLSLSGRPRVDGNVAKCLY